MTTLTPFIITDSPDRQIEKQIKLWSVKRRSDKQTDKGQLRWLILGCLHFETFENIS
jgi:hypothetical protein